MKLVREHINEKFHEESDPIHDMGIGIFSVKNFNSIEEAVNFIYSVFPGILKTNVIPEDIIELQSKTYKWEYYWEFIHYCEKYVKINGDSAVLNNRLFSQIYIVLQKKLCNKGFGKNYDNHKTPDPYKNHIFEKFVQDSDPIKDMEIGLINRYFKIHINNVGSYVFVERGPDFVKDNRPTKYVYTKSGNIYRYHLNLWLPQEIRSGSPAFNKGNPKKMPAKNLEEAKEIVLNHYLNARKRNGLII